MSLGVLNNNVGGGQKSRIRQSTSCILCWKENPVINCVVDYVSLLMKELEARMR
ncbi:MAG: hypothetical protein SVY53_08100 [Chloroflexota bacterium]|nr:hypothetical protein [Chloroflexota bacterium]